MFPYMPVAVIAKLAVALLDISISIRQRYRFHPTVKPSPRIAALVPPPKYTHAQKYCLAKSSFHILVSVFETALEALATIFYFTPTVWRYATARFPNSELRATLAFCAVLFFSSSVLDLPPSLYSTFVLEANFGFNKTSVATFVYDWCVDAVISLCFGVPIILAVFHVLEATSHFSPFTVALALWALSSALMIVMLILYPSVIAPLFNTFVPLSDPQLSSRLRTLSARLSFPLSAIYVIDGSRRSSHSNAYVFGLFRKYICIYDTLLQQASASKDQIVAILCHELGHWRLNHLQYSLAKALVHVFVVFLLYALTANNPDLFKSFGFVNETPLIVGLLLFNNLLSPLDDLLQPLHNYLSRRFEFQADAFAKRHGFAQSLGDALVMTSIENLSNMSPDPLYSAWNYSHPTLLERLDALNVSPRMPESLTRSSEQNSETTIATKEN